MFPAFDENGPTTELMCALRVATATDAEISELAARYTGQKKKKKKKDKPEAVFAKMVSEDSEAAALASLYETAAAILDSYPTSDAEDEAILRRGIREEEDVEGAEGAEGADTAVHDDDEDAKNRFPSLVDVDAQPAGAYRSARVDRSALMEVMSAF